MNTPREARLRVLEYAARRAAAGQSPAQLLVAPDRAAAVSIRVYYGLAIGAVTAIVSSCTPFIEWIADHLPEKRMGVFGIGLILIGFTLQSVQYWVALLDIGIRF